MTTWRGSQLHRAAKAHAAWIQLWETLHKQGVSWRFELAVSFGVSPTVHQL